MSNHEVTGKVSGADRRNECTREEKTADQGAQPLPPYRRSGPHQRLTLKIPRSEQQFQPARLGTTRGRRDT